MINWASYETNNMIRYYMAFHVFFTFFILMWAAQFKHHFAEIMKPVLEEDGKYMDEE